MKFKPKLVRSKQLDALSTTGATEEEVARSQWERIQKLQQQEQINDQKEEVSPYPIIDAGKNEVVPTAKFKDRTHAPAGISHLDKSSSPKVHFSDDSATLVDMFSSSEGTVPSTTPPLPPDTLYSTLMADSASRGIYRPVPLTSSTGQSVDSSLSGSPSSSTVIQDDATAGTSFLRAREIELQASYRNNQLLFENVIQPSTQHSSSLNDSSSLVWIQLPRFHEISSPGSDTSVTQDSNEKNDWEANKSGYPAGATRPRHIPFDLHRLPPGKIGDVKVYRSGRMTMTINGCCYNLLAESSEQGENSFSSGGSCCLAALITPESENSSSPSDTATVAPPQATCHLLDILQHKLVAVPTIVDLTNS